MLFCCQETDPTGSTHSDQQKYGDLKTITQNSLYQEAPKMKAVEKDSAPKIMVYLDNDIQPLPTYCPGRNITGQVKIELDEDNSPIQISHLRIALFGNVQVYGEYPGHPLNNGLFDYQENVQLINTGLRIVRKPESISKQQESGVSDVRSTVAQSTSTTSTPSFTSADHQNKQHDSSATTVPNNDNTHTSENDEIRWKLYCRKDDYLRSNIEEYNNTNKRQSLAKVKPKSKKAPEDRHMEKLIRKAAAIDRTSNVSSGILHDDMKCFYPEEVCSAFELGSSKANSSTTTNTIAFAIRVPTSKQLSCTFDHSHYPVSYRVVAIMKCRDKENKEITCYSTARLCLESSLDFNAPQYNKRIQSNPARQYVQGDDSLFGGICTFVLSSSAVISHWLLKMTKESNRVSPNYGLSYIQGHLEISKQAFKCSQYIPLELKLSNHAAPNFKISEIEICIEFVRRINMTCSINEVLEEIVLQASTVVFKSIEEEQSEDCHVQDDDLVFFKHANMCFDLSKLIQVPEDCTSTISAESTRNVFTLNYDVNVKVNFTGVTQLQQVKNSNDTLPSPAEHQKEIHYYYAKDKHLLREQYGENGLLPKGPNNQTFKTYSLQLEPLTVVIGNFSN